METVVYKGTQVPTRARSNIVLSVLVRAATMNKNSITMSQLVFMQVAYWSRVRELGTETQ